ncbi:MAG: Fic family protein [Candidatus Paceibacterota bacterium]
MFQPKYIINPKVLENIKRIGILISELNNRRFPKIIFVELERSARELSVFSSTSIEGNPLPLTDVKRILQQAPAHIRDTEKEVLNYNKALLYLQELQLQGRVEMNPELLKKIHGLVTEGLIEPHRQAAFRAEPVFVNDPRTRKTVYLPPDHSDVLGLVNDLASFISLNEKKLDPLILAGIFHRQFVIIHPFIDGNGRTTRLATKVLLARMGLDTFNLFSFENYYNKNVTKYFRAIGLSGNYYELLDTIDFTAWLEYFTDGVIDELLRVKKELEKTGNNLSIGLRPEYEIILKYISEHGAIADRHYSALTPRARATRSLDFKKMTTLGLIERKGKGKGTYYVKSERLA